MKTIFTSILLLFGLGNLVACKSMHNVFYEYEKPGVTTAHGFFNLTFNSEPKLSTVDGKEVVVWTEPYYFNTQYLSTKDTFLKGEINHLEIKSVQTGEVIYTEEHIIDVYRSSSSSLRNHTSKQKKLLGFGAGPLDMPYEDYAVSFEYIIYKDEDTIFDQGKVENMIVKRDYYEGKQKKGVGIL